MMDMRVEMPASLDGPPFVVVAHDIEGRWDVYARKFDEPMASFAERQQACNFASDLAKLRRDCLILLRDPKIAARTHCHA
jgi:hypothetical protein